MMITQIQKQLTLQAAVIRLAGDMYGNNLKALQTVTRSLAGIPAAQMRVLNAAVSEDVAEVAEAPVKAAKPAARKKVTPAKRPVPARPKPALKAKSSPVPAPAPVVKAKTKPVVTPQVVAKIPKAVAVKSPKPALTKVKSAAVKVPAKPAPAQPVVAKPVVKEPVAAKPAPIAKPAEPAAKHPRVPSRPASLPRKNNASKV